MQLVLNQVEAVQAGRTWKLPEASKQGQHGDFILRPHSKTLSQK